MRAGERLVCVHRAPHLIEANLLRGMLEHGGIPVTLTGENLVGAYAGVPMLSEVRIMVPERFRPAAESLLRDYETRMSPPGSPADWRCRLCGELNDDHFEICWQCECPRHAA
jgi:hypothetical protein